MDTPFDLTLPPAPVAPPPPSLLGRPTLAGLRRTPVRVFRPPSRSASPVTAPKKKAPSTGQAAFRLPRPDGPRVTERDMAMLTWIGLHGIVTPEQVARHFFLRDDGDVGQWAAYRRLRKLEQLDLLQRDRVYWRHPTVLRLTGAGARVADCGVGPAKLVMAEVPHCLAVVDLLEQLREKAPRGTVITTERELRIQRRREMRDDPRKVGRGRIPDALLAWSGKNVALELDLTNKRTIDMERILLTYLDDHYDQVWWYVRPAAVPRLREVVAKNRATDLVTVRTWEG